MKIMQMQVAPIGTNCYILVDESTNAAAVVDPGGSDEAVIRQLEGLDVKCILLTHGHFDHTGAVAALRRALPGVTVYLHPADQALLGAGDMPAVGETSPCQEGDVIALGGLEIHVLHTPGHTPGSVCYQVGDVLFTGDTLFQGSMGRTDLTGGSYDQIMASLKRLGNLPGNCQVLPGHMDTSTLDAERKGNYYLRQAMGG
jgi:hydroxyacylglutathione hydrolase